MPRLYLLDALGLAYRAYYAFIGRPLRHVLATAAEAGVARLEGVETVTHQNAGMAVGDGGAIVIEAPGGRIVQRVQVPPGSYVLVEDGVAVPAGRGLLAQN